MRFRSFRGRLVIVFVGLFAVIQATCFLVVAVAVRTSARKEINEELRLAGTLFTRRMRGEPEKTARPLTLGAGEPAQVAFVVSLKTEWRIPRRIDPYKGSPGN